MRSREALFRPTRQESRADLTDRVAREIIEEETTARHQKIERLRSARLGKEATEKSAKRAASSPKQPRKAR